MNTETKLSTKRQVICIAILIILFVSTFYFIHVNILSIDGHMLISVVKELRMGYLGLGILCLFFYVYFEGRCMALISASLGYKINSVKSTGYAAIDLYYSGITPSSLGGQPAVAYYMSRDGIEISKSSTILLLNTIEYISTLVVMGLIVMVTFPALIFSGSLAFSILFVVGMVTNVLLIIACLFCMCHQELVRKISLFFINVLCKIKICRSRDSKIESLNHHLDEYKACIHLIKGNYKMLIKVFFVNTLQRISFFSIAYFVYLSFGLNTYSYFYILATQIVIAVAVNSLPLPGGVGAAEGVFLTLYTIVYTDNLVLPAMIITRGINYFILLIICGSISIQKHIRLLRIKSD